MKKTGKRVLSVLLSVLMCLTVFALDWSGLINLSPEAEAWSAGSYKWRIRVHSNNNTGGWDADKLTVYGKATNGTGSEVEIYSHSNWYIDFKGDRYNTFGDGDQTTSQFPTKVTYFYQFGGGITHRKMDAYIYLDLYYGDDWHEIGSVQCYSYEWGQNKGTKTMTIASGNYPKFNSAAITGGSSELTAPATGSTGTNATNAFKVTAYDQYGVSWGVSGTSVAWTKSGTVDYAPLSFSSTTSETPTLKAGAVTKSSAPKTETLTATVKYGSTTKTATTTVKVIVKK